jgi:septum formation protein
VRVSGVDEVALLAAAPGATPTASCELLAVAKAREIAPLERDSLVLGCDSLLLLNGELHGKPHDVNEARQRWAHMAGHSGELLTGHCLIDTTTGRQLTAVASTIVRFSIPTPGELEAYLASGEPLAVAGAFTLDGLGGAFVESIDGDPHNVVGVSLPLLRRLLADLGIPISDLWAS